ncbi:MAG: phage tail protein [Gemmatimonadota bacterium]
MAEPYISEIRIMAFDYPPRGWAFCDGTTLSIAQHQALFALLGTTYGGDGRTTFELPDLRGRAPLHRTTDGSHPQGQSAGAAEVQLTMATVPGEHTHPANAAEAAPDEPSPEGHSLAELDGLYYAGDSPTQPTTLSPQTIGSSGGQAHENRQPYLAVPFCIALTGVFPSRD